MDPVLSSDAEFDVQEPQPIPAWYTPISSLYGADSRDCLDQREDEKDPSSCIQKNDPDISLIPWWKPCPRICGSPFRGKPCSTKQRAQKSRYCGGDNSEKLPQIKKPKAVLDKRHFSSRRNNSSSGRRSSSLSDLYMEKPSPIYQHDILSLYLTEEQLSLYFEPNKNYSTPPKNCIDEKKVICKIDWNIIPMVVFLFMLNFLDRGNIGNAKIEGLEKSLGMVGMQYNIALTVFYLPYSVFQPVCNVLNKRFGASKAFPIMTIAWSIVMICTGFVKSYHELLAARVFLGIAGAGILPGISSYLTQWYSREQLQLRIALFFTAASLAGAVSGLLAFDIAKLDGVGGLEGWRWIFIIEGFIGIPVASAALKFIYDTPETAKFLKLEERQWVIEKVRTQGSLYIAGEEETFGWGYVKAAFTDWQIWVGVWMFWGVACPIYGITFFLPTFLNDLGSQFHSNWNAQLLTIPIYISSALCTVYIAIKADTSKHGRAPWILLPMAFTALGFIITFTASALGDAPLVVYFGVMIATCGMFSAFPGNLTWIASNLKGRYKQSIGIALHIGAGNLAGAGAANFYPGRQAPKYIMGHVLEIGFIIAGMVAVVVLRINYGFINRERQRVMEKSEANERGWHGVRGVGNRSPRRSTSVKSEMGDRVLDFRYTL